MKKYFILFLILIFIIFTNSFSSSISFHQTSEIKSSGFFNGFIDGLILLFSFLLSLFNNDVVIYEIYNNGGWYDFGFLLGISFFRYITSDS